jgi:ribosomal protein L44E
MIGGYRRFKCSCGHEITLKPLRKGMIFATCTRCGKKHQSNAAGQFKQAGDSRPSFDMYKTMIDGLD